MLDLKFEPKTPGFTGHLVISVPSYIEKLKLMKQMGISVNEENQVDLSGFSKMDVIEKASMVIESALPLIKEVHLKYEDKEISKETLEHYDQGLAVLMEVFSFVCQGLSLGKS